MLIFYNNDRNPYMSSSVIDQQDMDHVHRFLPNGGSTTLIQLPYRAMHWISTHQNHPRLRKIQHGLKTALPMPFILFPHVEAIGILTSSESMKNPSRDLQSLADESRFPVVLRSSEFGNLQVQ